MKYLAQMSGETTWKDIERTIRRQVASPGDELVINGCRWRVLDVQENSMLIWKFTGVKDHVFNEDGSNVYEGSHIQRYLMEEFWKDLPEEMLHLVSVEGFFLLTEEQIMQYMPNEIDRIAADAEGNTTWWWTASPNVGDGKDVRLIYPAGFVGSDYANYSGGVAPACWLISNPE